MSELKLKLIDDFHDHTVQLSNLTLARLELGTDSRALGKRSCMTGKVLASARKALAFALLATRARARTCTSNNLITRTRARACAHNIKASVDSI